jgi:hypothetical protein
MSAKFKSASVPKFSTSGSPIGQNKLTTGAAIVIKNASFHFTFMKFSFGGKYTGFYCKFSNSLVIKVCFG